MIYESKEYDEHLHDIKEENKLIDMYQSDILEAIRELKELGKWEQLIQL